MSIDTGQDRVYNQNYPISGVGQTSQQFRDNFSVIKNALENIQGARAGNASILSISLDTSILDGSIRFNIGYPTVSNVAPATAGTLRYLNGSMQFWNGGTWSQIIASDNTSVGQGIVFTGGLTASTFTGNAVSSRSCVAQRFQADTSYPVGTVVVYGGNAEVTVTNVAADPRIAGVVVASAGYTLDDGTPSSDTSPYVALLGRASCFVSGPVEKGDLLVTSEVPGVAIAEPTIAFGAIIGKSLETKTSSNVSLISVSIQRC